MKGYPLLITPEQKREIIARIKEKGERVADLAKEYGVQPRIIYGYLSRSGQHSGTFFLKVLMFNHQCQRKPGPGRTATRNHFTLALN